MRVGWLLAAFALLASGCEIIGGIDDRRIQPLGAGAAGGEGGGIGEGGAGGGPHCASGDVTCDPENCGTIAHGCVGGACEDGVCLPVAVASDQGLIAGLAVQDGVVYWAAADASEVRYCSDPVCGTTPLVAATGQLNVNHVTTNARGVYWIRDGGFAGCRLATPNCEGSLVLEASGVGYPSALVADRSGSESVFVGLTGPLPEAGIYVKRDDPSPLNSYFDTSSAERLATESGSVFWADAVESKIFGCAMSGCVTPKAFVQDFAIGSGLHFAVREDLLFIADEPGGLYRCDTTSFPCEPELIGSAVTRVFTFVVDASSMYFSLDDKDDLRIFRMDLATGNSQTLADGHGNVTHMVDDDVAVYWATASPEQGGSVYRVAK